MQKPTPSIRLFQIALVGAMLAGPLGCATWRDTGSGKLISKLDMPDGVPWKAEKVRRGVPRRMVATWTDTVKQQPGMDAQRGFGGRIFFYDSSEAKPIGVEGRLVVYAFDETDRLPTDNRPTKRFVFPAEQLELHESECEFGLSYSVWLPWDEVGRPQTDVSLIARFEPVRGGSLIVSDQARQRLPGSMDAAAPTALVANPGNASGVINAGGFVDTSAGLRAATYEANAGQGQNTTGLETTTIKLGGKTARSTSAGATQRAAVSYGRLSQ